MTKKTPISYAYFFSGCLTI